VPGLSGELVQLGGANSLVAGPAGDGHDPDVGKSLLESDLQARGKIVRRRDIPAPDDRMKAVPQQLRDQLDTARQLGVARRIDQVAGHLAQRAQSPAIGLIQDRLGGLDGGGRLFVISTILGGFKDERAEIGLVFARFDCLVAGGQRRDGGRRA